MRTSYFAALFVAAAAAGTFFSAGVSADTGGTCEGGSCPLTATSDCAKGACAGETFTTAADECEGGTCPISAAVAKSMKTLPQLEFVIGDECTQCEKTAANWASTNQKPLQYAVGEKKFSDKGKAYDALIAQTESMLASFVKPETCAKSGMTTVAGEACSCPVMAGQIAKKAKDAAATITVAYRVGDETCSCPKTSAAMAKEAGVDRTFLVGEVETTCAKTARLAYARARYEAAAKAAAELKLASAQ
ncbi:MAG: hypothetical protein AAF802_06305 [Planctomycetota bacterium]